MSPVKKLLSEQSETQIGHPPAVKKEKPPTAVHAPKADGQELQERLSRGIKMELVDKEGTRADRRDPQIERSDAELMEISDDPARSGRRNSLSQSSVLRFWPRGSAPDRRPDEGAKVEETAAFRVAAASVTWPTM